MIARNLALFCFLPGVLTLALLADAAAASKGTTMPGTYRNWNGDMDEVTIVQPFRLDAYNDIAVESFDVGKVTLPNPKENTYEAVRSALGSIKPAFLEGFQENLRRKPGGANPVRGKGADSGYPSASDQAGSRLSGRTVLGRIRSWRCENRDDGRGC